MKQRFNLSPLRDEIVRLYREGWSSRKIGLTLNLSHVRILKILNSEGLERRKIVKSIPNVTYKNLTHERAYLFGVMCGDGCIFSGTEHKSKWSFKSHIVYLSVKDRDFLDEYVLAFSRVYGIKPRIYYRERKNGKWSNIWTARVNRKLVYEDLVSYNFGKFWVVPHEIMVANEETICAFLRGLYDSEGSVSLGPRGAAITICSVSKEGLEQVRGLVLKIGINVSRMMVDARSFRKNSLFYFYITGSKNYLLFLKKIGFSIKRKETKLIQYLNGLKKEISSV